MIAAGIAALGSSFKTKVMLAATTFFLLALVLVSAVQLHYVQLHMKQVLADQQLSMVSRLADDLDQKISLNLQALIAASGAFRPEMAGDAQALERTLAGLPVLRTLFDDVFMYSAGGRVLLDSPVRGRRGADVSGQENYRQVMATRKPHISRPFIGRVLKQPVVTMSAPILDRDGKVVAILAGSLNLLKPNFLGNIGNASVGKSGAYALLTRDRMIVASRDRGRIMTQGPAPGVSPYFDRATSGVEGVEENVNSRGLHALFAYSPLATVPWVLVAALPVEEAYVPIGAAQTRILQVTLLLALLTAPLVWLGTRYALKPLVALRDKFREIRDNPSALDEVPVSRRDEIGDLAVDFNEMLRAKRRAADERNLLNTELNARNQQLADANRAKDIFLAGMSHELRTPLNAIIGFTGTLLMKLPGPLNVEQEKQLKIVRTGASHLLALINDLLDLAKIEAGKAALVLQPTECKFVLEEIAASLRPQAEAKGLFFTLAFEEPGPTLTTDRRKLSQILINLIGNAIKFTERGGVQVQMARRGKGESRCVEFSVTDSGIGIRPEDQGRLFEPFSRLHAGAPEGIEGAGLGLHLSRRLAAELGGRIVIDSSFGLGSTFTLQLPDR
jgi:signal transduction histidine kinase